MTPPVWLDRRTEADAAEVRALLVAVFDDTSPAWFDAGILDPPYPESFGFVARAGGRIVSHAEVLEMPLRYGEATLRMGAVADVVTLPEWRRRGLASALMERLVTEMSARRVPLSLLLTGGPSFYERLGWSDWTPPGLSLAWEEAMVDSGAPAGHGAYRVAPYTPADLEEMRALYDRFNAGRPGTLLRPDHYWRSVMVRWLEATESPGQHNVVLVARRDGRLVAYAFASSDEDEFLLSEVAYEEEEAVLPLLRGLVRGAGEPAPGRLVAVLPWESAALAPMAATGRSVPNAPMGLMWRINDLPELLRQVAPALERRLAAMPRAGGTTLLFACERAEAVLRLEGGRVEVGGRQAWPALPEGTCRLTQADLVTLLLGAYPSAAWLAERGVPEAARPWLTCLFPPARGIFWLTDNF